MSSLSEQFGAIDIYLFDQILRGNIAPGMRILDVGCGEGRNLIYLLRAGYDVYGTDTNPRAVEFVRQLAATLAPQLPPSNFRVEPLESMSFPDEFADVVICNTVLHLAKDDEQFLAMLRGAWRTLRQGGLFFSRLASSIGHEDKIRNVNGRRFALPDGSERYLVDEAMLERLARELGGTMIDPLKTTVVQNQRSMTTWVLRRLKPGG